MTQNSMKLVRPSSPSEKHTRSTVDTIEVTPKLVASWKTPPFQRELRINAKVQAVAKQIAEDGGVLPGIITRGVLDGDTFIVDGQHRIQAFTIADIPIGYADVRTVFFSTMAEMAEEFERLNSQLVTLRPDDKLRALEHSLVTLQKLRRRCPFIGYGHLRRGDKAPIVSMSTFLRAWIGSRGDAPTTTMPVTTVVKTMTADDVDHAVEFATICFDVWERDREFGKLWGGLNLVMCAWIYRRVVLMEGATGAKRWTKLSREQFKRGLQALSADGGYLEFLVGRLVSERDRPPTYSRIRAIYAKRLREEFAGGRIMFPQPAWATH